MNLINFLPAKFLEEQARRRRVRREVGLIALSAIAAAGWCVSTRGSLDELRAYADALQTQTASIRDQQTEMTRLEQQKTALEQQVKIQRELLQPLETSSILATVSRLMPGSVALTELEVSGRRIVPPPPRPKEAEGEKRPDPPKPAPEALRIEMVGLAPSDGEVADFVGGLSRHPLFHRVKMVYTRAVTSGDLLAREFRVEMEVPLDREYRPLAAAEEADHAP